MRGFVASLASKPRGLAGGPHKAPPPSTPNTLQHSPAPRLTVGLPLMPLKGVLGSGCWPFPSVLGGSWGIAKHVSTNLGNGPQRSSSRPRAPQDLWSPWPEARRRWSETQIPGQGLVNSLAEQPKSVWALEPPVGIPTGRGRPGALASRSTCLPAPLPRQATPAQQCCVCTLSVPFGTSISRFFRSVQSARSMTSSQAKFGAEKHHFKKNCPITRAFGLRNLKK